MAVSRISSTTTCLMMKAGRGEAANRNTFDEGTDHHHIDLWEIWKSVNDKVITLVRVQLPVMVRERSSLSEEKL